MKKSAVSVFLVLVVVTVSSGCSTQSTPAPSEIPSPFDSPRTTVPTVVDECSQSNPIVDNWLRETTPADTLTLSALQAAGDLYSNPRDTGKQEALDWQQRTVQAYDFMKEYQPIPQCLVDYHNLVTETLLQLSLTFSELELAYVAIDSNQDYKPHLNAAKESLSAALEASKASVNEWDKLKSSGLFPDETNVPVLTPTFAPGQSTANEITCTKEWATSYLANVDAAMKKANKLANDFGQTQTREEATSIAKQVDELFTEVSLWKVADCAKDVQKDLMLVIVNISTMQQDILHNDMASYNRDYQTYKIAATQLNNEALKFSNSVKSR